MCLILEWKHFKNNVNQSWTDHFKWAERLLLNSCDDGIDPEENNNGVDGGHGYHFSHTHCMEAIWGRLLWNRNLIPGAWAVHWSLPGTLDLWDSRNVQNQDQTPLFLTFVHICLFPESCNTGLQDKRSCNHSLAHSPEQKKWIWISICPEWGRVRTTSSSWQSLWCTLATPLCALSHGSLSHLPALVP